MYVVSIRLSIVGLTSCQVLSFRSTLMHSRLQKKLDEERGQGKVRGRLHGIPFLVKDNMATKDRMETTAGSWALLGSVVPRDAHVIRKLRDAGAVLLGKTTLTEWADMRSNDYSDAYSGRGGQGRNAYNLTVSPGGEQFWLCGCCRC